MDIKEFVQDNTLLIVPSNIKTRILESISNDDKLLNIKLMDLNEVKKHLYFDYTTESKLFIMDKYSLKEDIASTILELLYITQDKTYKDEKLIFLKEVKDSLEENGLLVYDPLFRKYIKNKNIVVYGYSSINKFDTNMLESLSARFINCDRKLKTNKVHILSTLEDEVEYVFMSIAKLIHQGIDINNIKLVNVDEAYFYTIKRFSKIFNIPVEINDNYIYSSLIVKEYLNTLEKTKSFKETLDTLKERFDFTKENNSNIYSILLRISNKYNELDYSFDNIFTLVTKDIKNSKLNLSKLEDKIEITSLENNLFTDCFVFLLGFNQGNIPRLYKDEDYLSDHIKEEYDLLLETTSSKNLLCKNSVITSLKGIDNLFITAKEKSIDTTFMVSSLVEELNFSIDYPKIDYRESLSEASLKIRLTKLLDQLIKYGIMSDELSLLYNNTNVDYLTYSNKFSGIDNELLIKKLLPKLTLSYTHLDSYYHCAFKYYVSHILKLDKYEENFNTVIGTMFHYILSICFNDDFDFSSEYDKYIDNLTLNNKERFFVIKLKQELALVIEQVKKMYFETGLTSLLLEHKITVDKSSIIPVYLTGIVDKIMYKTRENTLISLVDYKTGHSDINLYNVIYGLSMQLPIYLYLVVKSNLFTNVKFTGFYLQRILSGEVNYSVDKSYKEQKMNNLKLEGYSISDEALLEVFMPDYTNSNFIKSMKTTSKGFAHYSKVLSEEQIISLVDIIDKNIDNARDNILKGNFDINPKEIGNIKIGCDFCKFRDLCYKTNNDFVKLKENKSLDFLGGEDNA